MNLTIDDREFNLTFREYMKHTQRDVAEVLNQKAYSICLSATKLTRKADYSRMFLEIGPTAIAIVAQKVRILKSGVVKRGKILTQKVFAAAKNGAPRLALIINARRGQQGQPGFYGAEMRDAVEREWIKRARSIGFLRAGWLPPLHVLGQAITPKKAPEKRLSIEPKTPGRTAMSRGWAIPAKPGWRPEVGFWNTSGAERSNNPDVVKYVADGLQAAITQEIGRMAEHVARKMQATADRYSAR